MNNTTIENTKAFQELDPVTQIVYRKKEMMSRVKSEFQIAKQIGIQRYNETYFPRPYLLKVITELLEQN